MTDLLRQMIGKADHIIFNPIKEDTQLSGQILTTTYLVLLYLVGIVHWIIFFRAGDMSFANLDWGDGQFYYAVARDMILYQSIPYFTDITAPAWGDVRFLANPQSFMSPQIIVFPFLTIGQAVIFNTCLLYSLGFIGTLLIKKHFGLTVIPFTILYLLFNFNGHITSHISVGHSTWNGYFLLPYFFLLIFHILKEDNVALFRTPLLIAFVLLGMIMQGSFHIYVWCLMFLLLIGLTHRKYIVPMLISILFALGLSLFRLIPTAMVRLDYKASYASGYPTLNTLIDALTTVKAHLYEHPRNSIYDVGWHEHDIFIGFIGLAFIIYFGFYHRFTNLDFMKHHKFPALDLPIFIFILLSFGYVFDVISDLQIPLLSWAERVPSRFLVMPLVLLTFISAVRMEDILPKIRDSIILKVGIISGTFLLTHSLFAHSWFWKLNKSTNTEKNPVINLSFDFPIGYDQFYLVIVNISWVLSLLVMVAAIILFISQKKIN